VCVGWGGILTQYDLGLEQQFLQHSSLAQLELLAQLSHLIAYTTPVLGPLAALAAERVYLGVDVADKRRLLAGGDERLQGVALQLLRHARRVPQADTLYLLPVHKQQVKKFLWKMSLRGSRLTKAAVLGFRDILVRIRIRTSD
jgi:hypothetical protein